MKTTIESVEKAYREINHFISDVNVIDVAYPNHDGVQDAEATSELIELYTRCANLIKGCKMAMKHIESIFTYDVVFNDDTDSNGKGWHSSLEECKKYIELYNGSNESYFESYKSGVVSVVCNETGETVYEEVIKQSY